MSVIVVFLRPLGLRLIKMNACHPRDIIDQILDISRYKEAAPKLERDIIDEAWNNYFVEI